VTTGPAPGSVLAEVGSEGAHFLERVRGIHPLLALAVSGLLFWLGPTIASRAGGAVGAASSASAVRSAGAAGAAPWSRGLLACLVGRLGLGFLNVWLSAPGWLQVVHLAAALAVWLCWVGLAFTVLAEDPGSA